MQFREAPHVQLVDHQLVVRGQRLNKTKEKPLFSGSSNWLWSSTA
jgi:hypothetical protein